MIFFDIWEMRWVLISVLALITSGDIRTSSHHIAHVKYVQCVFVIRESQ